MHAASVSMTVFMYVGMNLHMCVFMHAIYAEDRGLP